MTDPLYTDEEIKLAALLKDEWENDDGGFPWIARRILDHLRANPVHPKDKLPCDVMLPPRTIILKGCEVETLLAALKVREGMPHNLSKFSASEEVKERSNDLADFLINRAKQ